jgi:hypothetical protein
MVKVFRLFLYFAGALLMITATAKIVSAAGSAQILTYRDPILAISFRDLFLLAGMVEMVIAVACFFAKQMTVQASLVAWLATNFLFYRFGLFLVGYHRPCPCLGNLTDAIHIPPQTADTVMKMILAYLLIGSYGTLFWLWRQCRNTMQAV